MSESSDAFIFVSEIDYAQPMLALDDIATGIEDLGPVAEDAAAKVTESLDQVDAALAQDAAATDNADSAFSGLDGALSSIIDYLDLLTETSLNTLDGIGGLTGALASVGDAADTADSGISSTDDLLSSLIDMLGAAADAALGFGEALTEGLSSMEGFGGGIGRLLGIIVGFQLFNDAGKAITFFGDSMFGGNATLQQFQMQLTALTGSSSAANKLLAWTYQFGLQIPDTTQNLQKAVVTIESLGLNAQQIVPDLAEVAATMGVKLPVAAQAFMDAFEGRFFMMQRQLRISKEMLIPFGLELSKHGKIVQDTLAPAFERFVAAKFPNALAIAMQTWNGAMANATDLVQQIAMHLGAPVFGQFLGLLLTMEQTVAAHKQAWFDTATAIGDVLGGAIGRVITFLETLFGWLTHTHGALLTLGAALGGVFALGLTSAIIGILGMVSGLLPLIAIGSAVGSAIGFVANAFVTAYQQSAALRAWLATLGDAFHTLLDAIHPLIDQGFTALKGALGGLAQDLVKFFSSPQFISFIDQLAQALYRLAADIQHPQQLLHDLAGVFGPLIGFIAQIAPLVLGLGGGFGLLASGGLEPLIGLIRGGRGYLAGLMSLLEGMGGTLSPLTGILLNASIIFGGLWQQVVKFGGSLLSLPLDLLESLPRILTLKLTGGLFDAAEWKGLADTLGNFLTHLGNVSTLFDGLKTAVSGLLTGGLDGLMALLSQGVGALGGFASGLLEAAVAAAPIIAAVAVVAIVVYSVVAAFIHFWNTSAGFRAAIAGIGDQFKQLGGLLVSTLLPVWNQLQSTIKTQLIPAWNDLRMAFNELQPVFIFIGAIILGVLAVALGLLIGIIKGVITALGPVLTGIIEIFGGIATVIAGVMKFIGDFVSGWLTFFNDLFHGRFMQAARDITSIWSHLWDDVKQIFAGLWQIVVGLLTGFIGGIWALLSGFVSGVIGFFQMLWDKLVGHSIWPDMLHAMIQHAEAFVLNILNQIAQFVLALIAHFAMLALRALAEFSHMENELFAAVDHLVNRIPGQVQTLVDDIVSVIGQLPGIMLQAGEHMVQNFVSGIKNMAGGAMNAAAGLAGGVAKFLHFTVPDEGPLSDADTWMDHFGDLITTGLADQRAKVAVSAQVVGEAQRDHYLSGLGTKNGALAGDVSTATAAFPTGAPVSGVGAGAGNGPQTITVDFRSSNSMAFQTLLSLLSPSDRAAFAKMIGDQMARTSNLQYIDDRGYAG